MKMESARNRMGENYFQQRLEIISKFEKAKNNSYCVHIESVTKLFVCTLHSYFAHGKGEVSSINATPVLPILTWLQVTHELIGVNPLKYSCSGKYSL